MSPTPRSSTEDAARGEPVRPARRPLTVRGVHELPAARVVLHLPDLEALTSVALGPPPPAPRRRVDPPHVVEPAGEQETASHSPGARALGARADAARTAAGSAPAPSTGNGSSLVNLFKMPLDKLTPENIVQGGKKLGQLALLIQQPKMLLAAVAAVALQLAAVLAMLTGTGDTSSNNSGDGGRHRDAAPRGVPIVDHRHPIQTPINGPSQYSPMLPTFGSQRGPISVAQPAPPQPLPGVRSEELPAWGAEGPSLVTTPDGVPLAPPTGLAAPDNRTPAGSTRATPVGQSGAAVSGSTGSGNGSGAAGAVKPKLKGTILKVNEAAR